MIYYFDHLVKRSFGEFIQEQIQLNTDYIIGDGATNIKFFDAFPVDPVGFELPAISLDFASEAPRVDWDLGNEATHGYDFTLEIFANNNFERDLLAGIIKERIEKKSAIIYDYNYEPACNIGYLRNVNTSWMPIRIETPAGEEEYRARMSITIETLRNYY